MPLLVLGVGLGWLRWRSGRLAASVLMLGERPDATLLTATAMIVAGIALGTGGGSGARRVTRKP